VHEEHAICREAGARASIRIVVALARADMNGNLWYRLLVGHAALDVRAARDLAAHLIAAGEAGSGPA
jgi:hypothetical protein